MAGQDANTSRSAIRATLNSLEVNKQNQNGNVKGGVYSGGGPMMGTSKGGSSKKTKKM